MHLDQGQVKKKRQLQRLAWFLDSSIKIPGTPYSFGVDSLIGLVPGIGDAVGGLLSTWILMQGIRIKASAATLMHMTLNVALEVMLGFIPLIGDLFDIGWKANQRNVKLLERYLDQPESTSRVSFVWVLAAILFFMGVGVGTIWCGWQVLSWAFHALIGLFASSS